MKRFLAGALIGLLAVTGVTLAIDQLTKGDPDGTRIGQTSEKLCFFGSSCTTAVQPTGSAQGALTDNSGGTAAPTTGVSANAQKYTLTMVIPALAGLVNSETWKVSIPHAFTISSCAYRQLQKTTTGSKAATLQMGISGSATAGGAVSISSNSDTSAPGAIKAFSAITPASAIGAAGSSVDVAVSGVTAFTEGSGQVECTIVNTDKANESATFTALMNAIRSGLVTLGLIKGSS